MGYAVAQSGMEVSGRMDIEIRPFDVIEASSDDWSRLDEFMGEWYEVFYPDEEYQPGAMKKQIQIERSFVNITMYEAVDLQRDEKMAAFFWMMYFRKDSPSYEENKHMCEIRGPNVRQTYLRRGLATRMLPYIRDEMEKYGTHMLTGPAMNEAGRSLVQKIGGKEAQIMQDNRLNLSEVDWGMIHGWVDDGPRRSPRTQIEFYHSVPDDILEQYCDVYTEVFNQAPRDELKTGDTIFTPESWKETMERLSEAQAKYLTAVTLESDGSVSGLTDVIWLPERPAVLMQRLTGVRMKYRGRGLGKWLKGALLLRVKDEFPDVTSVSTANATSNDPMLDINRRMGFKLYREIYLYQLELEQLKKYLHRRHRIGITATKSILR